jgi:hypothetical protein
MEAAERCGRDRDPGQPSILRGTTPVDPKPEANTPDRYQLVP